MYITIAKPRHIKDNFARTCLNPERLVKALVKFDSTHGHLLCGEWVIRVVDSNKRLLAQLVGDGRTWRTILGPGMHHHSVNPRVYTIVM